MGIVLKYLTDYYSENWQGNVEYKIYPAKTFESTRRIPKVVRDSYKASLARAQAIPIMYRTSSKSCPSISVEAVLEGRSDPIEWFCHIYAFPCNCKVSHETIL